jgi:hypothetical protein
MKKLKTYIDLGGLDRPEAEILLPLIPDTEGFKCLREQLEEELAPVYEYTVECTDCPRTFTIESKKPITKKSIAEGGICVYCSDDYK